ncbi:hypothetical protein STENM223S_09864 [Streptomyces tendae]
MAVRLARWACLRTLAEARQKRQASHAGGRSGRQRASAGHQDAPAVAPEEQERRRRELAALAWPEAAGTSPEQREALELAVRHRLAAHEVAAVLGMAPAAARELLATAACEVERTRAALAVVETGACPGVAHLTGEQGMVLGTTLRRELVRHVDDCPRCRRTAERAVPGRWPGTSVTPDTLPLVPAPAATLHTALAHHPRARGGAPRFDRRGFPMNPKDRVARRDRLRARAVTTTVVATVVAAPVLALWAAYRGTPVGEGVGGGPSTAREDGTVDFDGGEGGAGYENAGNAQPRPGTRFGADGAPDVSVEVVEVAGAGHKGAAALGVTAAHSGDTTLITLTARGDAPVRWSASTGASWLYLNRSSGTLAPGESVTIRVFVDQLREPSGHWRATVAISPAGSVVSIEGYGPAPAGPVTGSPSAPGTPSGPPPSPSHPDPTPTTPTPTDPTPDRPAVLLRTRTPRRPRTPPRPTRRPPTRRPRTRPALPTPRPRTPAAPRLPAARTPRTRARRKHKTAPAPTQGTGAGRHRKQPVRPDSPGPPDAAPQRQLRRQPLLAQLDQPVVPRLAHQLDQLRPVRDVHRLARAVRRGRRRAPPVQVVAAGAPAPPVVLADRHLEHPRVVGPVDPLVRTPDRELPADVRLGLQRFAALLEGEDVQGAAHAALEARTVLEDARPLERAGLPLAVLVLGDPPVAGALRVVLPDVRREPRHMLGDALLVVLVREVGTQRAAPVVRAARLDALAAAAEDAVPPRGEPCQIAAEDLLVVRRIRKFHPRAGEVEALLVVGRRRPRRLRDRHPRRSAGQSGPLFLPGLFVRLLVLRLFRLWHPSRVSRRGPAGTAARP